MHSVVCVFEQNGWVSAKMAIGGPVLHADQSRAEGARPGGGQWERLAAAITLMARTT